MKSILAFALLFVVSVAASAAGPLYPAEQKDDPARLISTTHAVDDWLQSAQLLNNSTKQITSYRIGWVFVQDGKRSFHRGAWMSVPAGIDPGTKSTVPAQAVPPNWTASGTVFFVDELTFRDGSRWKMNHKTLRVPGVL